MRYLIALIVLLPALSFGADLVTTWGAVTKDDTGAALVVPVTEYRVYECGKPAPLEIVTGDILELTEQDIVTGSGSYCREVTAYLAPFEGDRVAATTIVVKPGEAVDVRVQAIP